MTDTIYASFIDIFDAERAIGALMDHGVKPENISLVANESHQGRLNAYSGTSTMNLSDFEDQAKTGITTTTSADAESGALAGAGIGLGLGLVAALASIFIPGVGLVVGGGTLAIALAGAAGTLGAGAITGGIIGYLKDQGVPDREAHEYHASVQQGGALVAVGPQGILTRYEVENLLKKYNAENVGEYSLANSR